ncbi:hypothetical protein KQH61_03390 [bacterium]|nr:hypothetical protein [bacterium]MCB2178944.1 hypothetical protein [bacterium]
MREQVTAAIRKFALWGLGEGLLAFVILLLLPADSKSAWLLGYSKIRWGLFLAVLTPAGLCFALFRHIQVKQSGSALVGWMQGTSTQLWSFVSKVAALLLLVGLLGVKMLWQSGLPNLVDILLRLLPVVVLALLILFQSLLLSFRINAAVSETPWYETLFRFLWAAAWLDRLEITLSAIIEGLAQKIPRPALLALFLGWPLLFNIVISYVFFGTGLRDFIPNDPDNVQYWIEATAFITGGLNGGQITVDHSVAKVDAVHFGVHGPSFPILQGSLGKLLGWHYYTPVLINLLFLLVAFSLFLVILKPRGKTLLGSWLLFALYTPIHIFIPQNLQQNWHQSLAIVIAALFAKWIGAHGKASGKTLYWLLLAVFIATLFRYTWLVMYFPILIVGWYYLDKKKWFALLGGVIVLGLLAFESASLFWSPYPADIRFMIMEAFHSSFGEGVGLILANVDKNLANLFTYEFPWVAVFRLQFGVLVFAGIAVLVRVIAEKQYRKPDKGTLLRVVSAINILGIFALNIILYYVRSWNDYRIWAPHVLLSLVLLLFARPKRVFLTVILLGLLLIFFPFQILDQFDFAHGQDVPRQMAEIEAFRESIADYLVYQPEQNRWCNTVEISKYGDNDQILTYVFTGLTPGFGYSSTLDWQGTSVADLIGKYVLLDPAYMEVAAPGYMDRLDLTFLTTTPLGNLYLNNNTICPD